MAKESIFNIKDFRGGYASDLNPQLMANNEMKVAENCWWKKGLKKRGGITRIASTTGSLKGAIRVYEETAGAWYTIQAVDDNANVQFQVGTSTETFLSIPAASIGVGATTTSTSPFTKGNDVEFAALGGKVIAVNGTDRPYAIWASGSGTFYGRDLDRYDERDRSTDNWYAGMATTTSGYTDDTTDAQTVAGVFLLASATNVTNGFYVAGDYTYSKLIFAGVDPDVMATASGLYQYYGGASGAATWTDIDTFNTKCLNSNGAHWGTGSVALEFELPLSSDGTLKWQKYDLSSGNLTNRYLVRGLFAGLTSSLTASYVKEMTHTHYLTQITGDQKPQAIETHKNHVFLAAKNQVQIGIANSIKGWRADRWEYFYEGGKEVLAMKSFNNFLAIIKAGRIFAIDGTSWQNWSVRPVGEGGIVSKRGAVVANNLLWMVDTDGIYVFDGVRRIKVSKHIQSDIDGYTLTDANLFFYKNDVLCSFPTNSVVLVFDPDTLRKDDMGDGRVSFYNWAPYLVRQFIYNSGGGDDGNLIGLGTNYTVLADYLAYDVLTAAIAISMTMQTKMYDFGGEQTIKHYTRAKPKVGEVSATGGQTYEFKFKTEDEFGGASNTATLTAGIGSGIYTKDVSVPYTMDGKLISFQIMHNSAYDARVDTISMEVRKRRY
jgi:hypothetical protein